MNLAALYFKWLQKDNPVGTVDRFPELKNKFETSVPGLYCAGDLTGIPLIKLAAESGCELIDRLKEDRAFREARANRTDDDVYDLVIVGAGPAGVSACLRAAELGWKHVVIESSRRFNTIENFPAGKPIYVTPQGPMQSDLVFTDGTKESLLEELRRDIEGKPLPIREGEMVKRIVKAASHFVIDSTRGQYKALRVIVAIGKTGNARQLGVPGERLPKVFTRLIDPGEHRGRDILVVGGGDSAVEAAIALAKTGNRVTLSYRQATLARPKQHNLEAFNALLADGVITPLFESTVEEVTGQEVRLSTPDGERTLPNDAVFALIGTEIPIRFFRRSKIRMERERNGRWWLGLATLVSFFTMLYFGKAGRAIDLFDGRGLFGAVGAYFTAPLKLRLPWGLAGHAWYESANFLLGWIGSVAFLVTGLILLVDVFRRREEYFSTTWGIVKHGYFIAVGVFFFIVYVGSELGRNAGWVAVPTFWYSLLYTTTIILFGARRIRKTPTLYIIAQTSTLMFVQTFFLFLLPFVLYENVLARVFDPADPVMTNLFPSGKWSSFAFVLFWPLNINEFGNSAFWSWFPLVQTFGLLFLIVYLWGKGAYCGWICSCGAMAETLGDDYRALAPHGERAKRMDNIGQVVLWAAVLCALLYVPYKLFHKANPAEYAIPVVSTTLWHGYKLVIDVFFAGVLGLGVYFFFGGRIWCRYGCPLAALMHVYTRFSPYRIMSNKKRCISCNICTKVCHMGIDVMGFANKGIPMNDVECVRCSACIVNCPMQVLTFGSVAKSDPANVAYQKHYVPLQRDWRAGLRAGDLAAILAEEAKQHPGLVRQAPPTGSRQ